MRMRITNISDQEEISSEDQSEKKSFESGNKNQIQTHMEEDSDDVISVDE